LFKDLALLVFFSILFFLVHGVIVPPPNYYDGYDCDGHGCDGYGYDGYYDDGYDCDGYSCDGYYDDGYDCDGYGCDGYDCELINPIEKVTIRLGTLEKKGTAKKKGIPEQSQENWLKNRGFPSDYLKIGLGSDRTKCANCNGWKDVDGLIRGAVGLSGKGSDELVCEAIVDASSGPPAVNYVLSFIVEYQDPAENGGDFGDGEEFWTKNLDVAERLDKSCIYKDYKYHCRAEIPQEKIERGENIRCDAALVIYRVPSEDAYHEMTSEKTFAVAKHNFYFFPVNYPGGAISWLSEFVVGEFIDFARPKNPNLGGEDIKPVPFTKFKFDLKNSDYEIITTKQTTAELPKNTELFCMKGVDNLEFENRRGTKLKASIKLGDGGVVEYIQVEAEILKNGSRLKLRNLAGKRVDNRSYLYDPYIFVGGTPGLLGGSSIANSDIFVDSTEDEFIPIVLHELGHFFSFRDEYLESVWDAQKLLGAQYNEFPTEGYTLIDNALGNRPCYSRILTDPFGDFVAPCNPPFNGMLFAGKRFGTDGTERSIMGAGNLTSCDPSIFTGYVYPAPLVINCKPYDEVIG